MNRYILRLDDACDTMKEEAWDAIENLCDDYSIKPIVGVIPANEDKSLCYTPKQPYFWRRVKQWQDKGWCCGLHGYNHVFLTRHSGFIKLQYKSEFAGVPLDVQKEKIGAGIEIFQKQGVFPTVWIAPSHTFDLNTLCALSECSDIRIISDGIGFYPYQEYNFTWIPQQYWRFHQRNWGIWTTCIHPNKITKDSIAKLQVFFQKNADFFINDITQVTKLYKNRTRSGPELLYENYFYVKRTMIEYLYTFKQSLLLHSL